MDLVYPSSLTAWSRKYLPDGSREEDSRTRMDIPDNVLASRTHGMSQGLQARPGSARARASGTRAQNRAASLPRWSGSWSRAEYTPIFPGPPRRAGC